MDTRERQNLINCYWTDHTGLQISSYIYTGSKQSITSVREGNHTPGVWRYNPVEIRRQSATADEVAWVDRVGCVNSGQQIVRHMYSLGYPLWNKTWSKSPDSVLFNTAKVDAHGKLDLAEIQAGVSLSELRETLRMLMNPIAGASRFMFKHFLRPTRKFSRQRAAKYCADKWLEYRYGWLPLACEVESVMDIIYSDAVWKRKPKLRVVRGSAYLDGEPWPSETWADYYQPYHRTGGTMTYSQKQTVRHVIGHRLTFENMTKLDRFLTSVGLQSGDIPTTLWEIIPFSFVVDWWFGVGDWLSAIKPKPYIHFDGEGASVKVEFEKKTTSTWANRQVTRTKWEPMAPFGSYTIKEEYYSRGAGSGWMFPPVKLGIGNVNHIIDSLSYTVSTVCKNIR